MLWTAFGMKGYAVSGIDGNLGTVTDLLFDDTVWRMRWIVVSTGQWFPDHDVLLPMAVLGYPDPARQQIEVTLTMQQIRGSLRIDGDLPVSQQVEVRSPLPHLPAGLSTGDAVLPSSESNDPHLRSVEAVVGHRVHATDGPIGHVDDFLVDDAGWSVHFVKVDTRNWGPARRVLLPPRLIRRIDWRARSVHLGVDRREIESRASHDPAAGAGPVEDEMLLACHDIRWVGE